MPCTAAAPAHRRGPARRAHQPQPQGQHARRRRRGAHPGRRPGPAGHRPRPRARQLGGRRRGRGRGPGAALPPRGRPGRRLPARARPVRRRPARPGGAGPGRGGLPAAARRAAVRQRLRHVRGAGPLPAHRGRARVPAAAALRRVRPRRRPDPARRSARGSTVPCHNDLLAENLLLDDGAGGERVRIIDYEYAGNNDPCFELGNIWSEATLPAPLLDVLVTAYFGRPRPVQVARARLFGLVSKYGWTLWASIQDGSSPLDFDFWSWGMEKYDRAVAEFDGPELAGLLELARRPDEAAADNVTPGDDLQHGLGRACDHTQRHADPRRAGRADRGRHDRHRAARVHRHAGPAAGQALCRRRTSSTRWCRMRPRRATTCSPSTSR